MDSHAWVTDFPAAITVCDRDGIIIEMNEASRRVFEKYGGGELLGQSLFDCHSPRSGETIRRLLQTGETNAYTIQKNGVRKLIYQCPWVQDGRVAGLVEISLPIPDEMPHFIRD